MKRHSNVTPSFKETLSPVSWVHRRHGTAWGFLGIVIFSFTLPATRLAVQDFDAVFVGLGRAVVAGLLAGLLLLLRRPHCPTRGQWIRLVIVSLGVVIGFPVFSALALQRMNASDAAVIVGLLPTATAVMAVLRAGERPSLGFWIAAAAGLLSVLIFATLQGAGTLQGAHVYALLAVVLAAVGYAEGGLLARTLGGWQVICWALVLTLPVLAPITVYRVWNTGLSGHFSAWVCFGYVSVFSMFLGFFAWYRGLALGGIAHVGQIQLLQPILTLLWSSLLLKETLTGTLLGAATLIVVCVLLTQRTRNALRSGDPNTAIQKQTLGVPPA